MDLNCFTLAPDPLAFRCVPIIYPKVRRRGAMFQSSLSCLCGGQLLYNSRQWWAEDSLDKSDKVDNASRLLEVREVPMSTA